ncbi:MAG TPA: ABC transporter ATP-binding protein [Candidatus Binatia bacterium]|nr:ABC transporter ATP-binding protein [Candidatus Binatia bacterium]
MSEPAPVLALTGVRLGRPGGFSLEVPALDVRAGEVLAVLGPNGSGKSTLLRVMALLERPDAGRVWAHGRPVDAADALAVRRRMAMVFQQPLLADTTVIENAALGLRFRGVPAAERRTRALGWLERLGVAALADRRARSLSGGEAQRVALARALVLEPEVLLLDEPFAALDEPTRAALIPDLAAILRAERVATVLVTHDRAEARALADRVAVLLGGRLEQVGPATEVFRSPASEAVARFVGVETILTGEVTAVGDGVSVVSVAGRAVQVAARMRPGERVRLGLRAEDVTLARPAADGAVSARNRLAGVVAAVRPAGDQLRVVVDVGFPVVAALTVRSAEELGLGEGRPVVVVFKASALHVIPGPPA